MVRRSSHPAEFVLDAYVIDTLLQDLVGHDRRASAFVVYLWLTRQCGLAQADECQASLADIADATGLSRRGVQNAIALLKRRRLLDVASESPTAVPNYTVLRPWRARARAT